MNTELLTVNRDNRYIQSSFQLTLNEARVLELAHAKVRFDTDPEPVLEFTAEEFSKAFNVDPRNAYKQMAEGVEELYERSADVIGALATDSISRFRLASESHYIESEGRVKVGLTRAMTQLLRVSKTSGGYTGYSLLQVKNLNSTHALRLYQILSRYKQNGWAEHTLGDWKFYFGVQDKYPRWVDFKKRVLNPAIKNLNEVSNYQVDKNYILKKKGRKIHRIKINFKDKDQLLLEL
jgi:plasmid replication initiation protein